MLNILTNVHILMMDGQCQRACLRVRKTYCEDPNKNFKADEEPVEETPVEPEVPQVETEKWKPNSKK